MFEEAKYTDLEVRCGDYTKKVHRSVVCMKSSYFANACKPDTFIVRGRRKHLFRRWLLHRNQEGQSGIVQLRAKEAGSDEGYDPKLIARLVHGLYHTNGYSGYDFDSSARAGSYSLSVCEKDPDPRRLILHAEMYLLGNYFGSSCAMEALKEFKKTLSVPSAGLLPPICQLLRGDFAKSNIATDPLRGMLIAHLAANAGLVAACPKTSELLEADKDLSHEIFMKHLQQKRSDDGLSKFMAPSHKSARK